MIMTTAIGRQAERATAEHLKRLGYKITGQNWKNRWCEIDIVAEKDKTVYFVEVKYRKSDRQGSGLDYITPKKLQQMGFAAQMWVNRYKWRGPYSLAAAEVSGPEFSVTNFLPDCSGNTF